MQLIFLDRNTLSYKDNGFVDKNFEINLDLVVSQKSYFVVNKTNINVVVGDIVALKEYNYFYIGIVESLELTNDHTTTVRTLDFKEIFNVEVPVQSYSGDVAIYIESIIKENFISNSDSMQVLPYLSVERVASKVGSLTFEVDKLMSITDVIELVSKTYGVSIISEVVFLRGRIIGIKVKIVEVSSGIKLKSNISAITDLVINDSSNRFVNKVIYYPKSDNVTYKEKVSFYLLTTGEITQDSENTLRYRSLTLKSFTYIDSDFPTLAQKARSEMLSSQLDHNITFNLKTDNLIINPFNNLCLGDFIEFITSNKIYDSVVTGIKFKDSFNQSTITLGEYRIKLTEKIQLLNKSVNSMAGNISITASGTTDLDGGEY